MGVSALDRLRSRENLRAVWKDYWRAAQKKVSSGVDGVTLKRFSDNLPANIQSLHVELKHGFHFSPLKGVPVPKADGIKKRLICVPTVRDRVVQRALLRILEEKASKLGIVNDVSYGFVKAVDGTKRGTGAARDAAIAQRNLRPWTFKADISAFFDTIRRDQLTRELERKFRLRSLLPLIRRAINCEIATDDPEVRRAAHDAGIRKGIGLRQGMPLSPILSNFLLRDFDASFARLGYSMVRYADDLVVFAEDKEACEKIKDHTVRELKKLGLDISAKKTFICDPTQSVDFLGMEIVSTAIGTYELRISEKQMEKVRDAFAVYRDIDYLISQKMDVGGLYKRLEQMQIGYRAAYGAASNYSDFSMRLDQHLQNCMTAIYRSIFGREPVSKLNRKQKDFLKIP